VRSPILVTGGTGRLGRLVVARLHDAGRDVRVLSRHGRASVPGIDFMAADLFDDAGFEPALEGVATIIHCAGSGKGDDVATLNLVRAASRAGTSHFVYISVIGADRIPVVSAIDRAMFGYFGFKRAAERIVAESGLPWTMLRASQFQGAFLAVAQQMARLPVIPVPAGFRFQPVDEGEVAARLVELALGTPRGLVPDLGGPRIYPMADLVRGYLRTTGKHRLILPVPTMGRAAAAFRAGANLAPERGVGHRTWEDLLAEQVSSPGDGRSVPA
jgi:uncharacterized protein YbjT (DUF2867 family)